MKPISRRKFLNDVGRGAVGAGLLGSGAPAVLDRLARRSPGESSRPNIVVIMADDMGFSDIGCYGGEIETPNLDRLAAGGLRFRQFYNTGRCCPSRASLLTGLYAHQAGMGHMTTSRWLRDTPGYEGRLNDHCVTVAESLKQAGYRTLMAGKWHVGREEGHWPIDRGFDRFYGEHTYVDGYFHATNQLYLNGREVEPEGADWYTTDAYTDQALDFVDEATDEDDPFFLYMAYNAPHFPLQAFQEDIDKYRDLYRDGWDEWRRRRYERMAELGVIDEQWPLSPRDERAPAWDDVEDKELESLKMAAYAAMIDRMDQNIGRILAKLEEIGAADDTLILFLSDNGGCAEDWINRRNPEGARPGDRNSMWAYGLPWANLSDTPFRLFKRWVHEGGIASPLIAHWPGVIEQRGGFTDEVGHIMDLMPTMLEAAGVEYPSEHDGREILPVEGRSLLPVLRGGSREGHSALFWEHEGNRAVRQGDWKLVARSRFEDGDWELYNLAEDRTELNNLVDDNPAKASELAVDYEQWANRVGVIPWDELQWKRRAT